MDDNTGKLFDGIFKDLTSGRLGAALHSIRSLLEVNAKLMPIEELDSIENDYRLMLDYMKRGFNDPQRENIYSSLIVRLRRYASDLYMASRTNSMSFFSECLRKAGAFQFSNDHIKAELENFVTDMAMLSLEPEPTRKSKTKVLFGNHNNFMQALFCHIVVAKQWSEHDAEFFENLLLSPTIDTIDAQVMVSALTVATMNSMDVNKFGVLINIYLKSKDEQLRQRALVGWVFSLASDTIHTEKLKRMVCAAVEEKSVVDELAELQKQIIYCLNVEQDTDKIRRDIMPDLINNNNLKITRFGITEKEDDPTDDVFDPGASDRAMEKVEESMKKMMDMQKAGSDIYFGGFSQMKRFPFFYSLANWFYPYFLEHPDISRATESLKDSPVLVNILNNGPFCDSDKYSFTLTLSTVISHLPENIKEMLNSQEALGQMISEDEQKSPTYIRRMILQDMYRFFRLYQQRSQLVNPFDSDRFMFVANTVFEGTTMSKAIPDLCFFMIKQNNKEALQQLCESYNNGQDPKMLLANGIYELNFAKRPEKAADIFETLKTLDTTNRRVLSLLARASFECGRLSRAVECYGELHSLDPTNKTATLNYCVALSKAERYEEAINMLYKLDIEEPDSMPVTRVLAWALMGAGKYEQSEKAYARLLKSDDVETGDWINAGYCQWLTGNIAEALRLFAKFKEARGENSADANLSQEFANDHTFLTGHGLSDIDLTLMSDLIEE